MDGIPGVDTAEIAKAGAASVWKNKPGIKILDEQYGQWSTSEAKKVAEQWIAKYGKNIQGVWSDGGQMSQGIVEAFQEAKLPVPPLASADYSNGLLRQVKDGHITFSAGQYPNAMVILCIDTALKILNGEPVPRFIDFRSAMEKTQDVNMSNIDTFFNPKWSDDVFPPIFLPGFEDGRTQIHEAVAIQIARGCGCGRVPARQRTHRHGLRLPPKEGCSAFSVVPKLRELRETRGRCEKGDVTGLVIKPPKPRGMTDAPILEMLNISKAFGGVQALRDVSFSCRKGKVHALLGENGAGKSTLIKILAGAYQADSGEIVFKGQRYAGFTAREAMATGISIIYQELNLVQFMTVAENIFLGREPRNRLGVIDTQRMTKESVDLLDRLRIPLSPSAQIGDLTVASQQMVEIAKALSQNADLIVMDEPSAILAGQELDSLFATIRSLVEQGVTIIYISHRLNEVFEIADDVTVLKDGRVVGAQPIGEVTRARLIQMMVGRPLEEIFPRATRPRGAPVLTRDECHDRTTAAPGQPDAPRGRNSGPRRDGRRGSNRSGAGAVRRGPAPLRRDPA